MECFKHMESYLLSQIYSFIKYNNLSGSRQFILAIIPILWKWNLAPSLAAKFKYHNIQYQVEGLSYQLQVLHLQKARY